MREATDAPLRAAKSRGFKDIPRGQGCRQVQKSNGGAKFVLKSFVHAARKPETGSFIRTGHMTAGNVLFKAPDTPYSLEMMNKVVAGGRFRPMDKPTQIEECRAEKLVLSQNTYSGAIECRSPGPPRPFHALPSST